MYTLRTPETKEKAKTFRKSCSLWRPGHAQRSPQAHRHPTLPKHAAWAAVPPARARPTRLDVSVLQEAQLINTERESAYRTWMTTPFHENSDKFPVAG